MNIQAKLGQENLVKKRYLLFTEAPHNTAFYEWVEKKHFCLFQTAETGKRTPNSSVKGSGVYVYINNRIFGHSKEYIFFVI